MTTFIKTKPPRATFKNNTRQKGLTNMSIPLQIADFNDYQAHKSAFSKQRKLEAIRLRKQEIKPNPPYPENAGRKAISETWLRVEMQKSLERQAEQYGRII